MTVKLPVPSLRQTATVPLPPISLAGLFDDSDDREPVAAPPVAPPPKSSGGEWDGVERRGAGRPWGEGPGREPAVADAVALVRERVVEELDRLAGLQTRGIVRRDGELRVQGFAGAGEGEA